MKFLPGADFTPRPESVGGSGRMPASEINQLANEPRELTVTVAARGALIPVLYGRRDVPGLVFASGKKGANLVMAYIWCIGEVDAVEAVYLNDDVIPAGVTVTSYLGTPTQGVDPTLAAALAAYGDTLRVTMPGGGRLGVCYSVVEIAPGAIGGFPRARAVIRGRKVLDPRTGTVGYSANPALMVHDLITNPVFGLGRQVVGIEACANWCDTLLGGAPGAFRARSAIYIASGRPAEQYILLLCEYAECLHIYEGATIRLIPDAPVDVASLPVIGAADIIAGSFSLQAESSIDTPTEVELQYTEPSATPQKAWALEPVVVRLPGVTEGEVQRVPTSITLDGVYRKVEAANKALSRLNRMQNRMTASWTTLDIGVAHQRGDVVRVALPARGVDMALRIESANLSGAGRYQVTASRYDASHYPSDAVMPGGDGYVPVGAIGMLVGTTVPSGWAAYNAADGRYIVGAGGALAVGATGGSANFPAIAGTSSVDGEHTLSESIPVSRTGGKPGGVSYYDSTYSGGAHSHTFSFAASAADLLRRDNPMVIKVGADDLQVPPEVRVFGVYNANTTASKVIQFAGRLLRASASAADAGVISANIGGGVTSYDGIHTHKGIYDNYHDGSAWAGVPMARSYDSSAGGHTHTVVASLQADVKRQALCVFGSATSYNIRPGFIFAWGGPVTGIPAGYVLCDGSSGSPDMRDRFAAFGADAKENPAGGNTVLARLTFSTEYHGHDAGAIYTNRPGWISAAHSEYAYHTHSQQVSAAFVPLYYALAFIMYAPAG